MTVRDIDERMVSDRIACTEPRCPFGHLLGVTSNDGAGAVARRPSPGIAASPSTPSVMLMSC